VAYTYPPLNVEIRTPRLTPALDHEPNDTDWDTRCGEPARIQRWRLTRDAWERGRRDDIEPTGVEECLPVLDLTPRCPVRGKSPAPSSRETGPLCARAIGLFGPAVSETPERNATVGPATEWEIPGDRPIGRSPSLYPISG
jgi:hypothetical protein